MKTRTLLLTATMLAVPVLASAQPVAGLYVGAGAGYNYLQNQLVTPDYSNDAVTLVPNQGSHLTGSGGPIASASLGYGFGNGFRVEIQADWRAQHDKYDHGVGGDYFGGADLQTYGGFVNALYDFNFGLPVFPYLGVGVGYEETFGRNFTLYRHNSFTGYLNEFDYSNDSQGSIAAQGIVGMAFPLSAIPGLSVTAEYRFMYVADFGNLRRQLHGSVRFLRGQEQDRVRNTTMPAWSACATPSTCRPRRRRRRRCRQHPRPLSRRAPTWCSSTGIAPT